jgi:hypothetical protein
MKNAPSGSSSSKPSRAETSDTEIERLKAEITELNNRRQSGRIFQLRPSLGIFEWGRIGRRHLNGQGPHG